jgi:hypothetical protein
LLVHLRDPEAAVRGMIRCLRPGGSIVIEDADFSGCFSSPGCDAFDQWVQWYQETVRRRGGDLTLGKRLRLCCAPSESERSWQPSCSQFSLKRSSSATGSYPLQDQKRSG